MVKKKLENYVLIKNKYIKHLSMLIIYFFFLLKI